MHSYSEWGGALRNLREGIRKFNQFCRHFSNLHEQDASEAGASTSADWLGQRLAKWMGWRVQEERYQGK
jgi:hypothetical protein